MNEKDFNRGMLFVGSPDGELQPIGEVSEMPMFETVENEDAPMINDTRLISEATFTITLTQDLVNAFFEKLLSIREMMLDLVRVEGYPRIAHLAKHARKHRTRKKNLFRAYQIARESLAYVVRGVECVKEDHDA